MRYKARLYNGITGSSRTVNLGRHDGYFQAEYDAVEKCPSGWQITAVWECKR